MAESSHTTSPFYGANTDPAVAVDAAAISLRALAVLIAKADVATFSQCERDGLSFLIDDLAGAIVTARTAMTARQDAQRHGTPRSAPDYKEMARSIIRELDVQGVFDSVACRAPNLRIIPGGQA